MDESLKFQLSRYFSIFIPVGLSIIGLQIILNYIAQIQKRLRLLMSEYFNLMNRMREGVLVLIRDPH